MSSYEVRVPEALILAPFQPWVKMVWISARSFQGGGTHCYASLDMIGERAVLGSGKAMDRGQVSHAIKALEAAGFIERQGNKRLRCLSPEVEPHSTKVEQDSTFTPEETPSKVEHHSTEVERGSTEVERGSTRSKNQQGKPTRKTNKRVEPEFSPDDWQMVFATTAFDRLLSLGLLPASMERKRTTTVQAFAAEFDKLRRLDEFDQETIADVMRWLLVPTNWWVQTANFRSVLKLRKPHKDGGTYFEQFLSQLRNQGHAKAKQSNHTSYTPADAERIYQLALAGATSAGA